MAVGLAWAAVAGVGVRSVDADGTAGLSLSRCVSRWNQAPLGRGRLYARVASLSGLMFAFSDGVCGLAVPKRVAEINDAALVYVQVLSGTYIWGEDPVAITAPLPPREIAAADRDAGKRANVRIDPVTNFVQPLSGGRLAHVAFPEATAAVKRQSCPIKRQSCPTISDPPTRFETPVEYDVASRTTTCAVTREIVWAYNDREGVAMKPRSAGLRRIARWRCVGRPTSTIPRNAPQTSGQITCANRSQRVTIQVSRGESSS